MLKDPLTFVQLVTDGTTLGKGSYELLEVKSFDDGRTVRVGTIGGNKATLQISNQETKENKGTPTSRATVRLTVTKQVPLIGPVSSSVSLSFALPSAGFTESELVQYVQDVLGLVIFTIGAPSGMGQPAAVPDFETLKRIIRGAV